MSYTKYSKSFDEFSNNNKSVYGFQIKDDIHAYSTLHNNQTMMVANNCPGYNSMENQYSNGVDSDKMINCSNCKNFQGNVCKVGLYDKVLFKINKE